LVISASIVSCSVWNRLLEIIKDYESVAIWLEEIALIAIFLLELIE
jgi:hypothetical protein